MKVTLARMQEMARTIANGQQRLYRMSVTSGRGSLIQGLPLSDEWRALIYRPQNGAIIFYEPPQSVSGIIAIHLPTADSPSLAEIMKSIDVKLPKDWTYERFGQVGTSMRQIAFTELNSRSAKAHPEELHLPENLFTMSQ